MNELEKALELINKAEEKCEGAYMEEFSHLDLCINMLLFRMQLEKEYKEW